MTKNPEITAQDILLKGGEFVVKDSVAAETFIPEDFNEEQLMIKGMIEEFIKSEINPNVAKIEKQAEGLSRELLSKAAEMGIIGSHIPEQYGGMEMDTNTNTLICDEMGPTGSFCTTFAAHTGIGMLPILYFGTEEQKQKYLPGLCAGKLAASYCLTEPSSGSDALAAKTRADLSEDGTSYIINGQKMWITNAGFADVFIVFAQVDGEKFTGFIVERGAEGMTFGAEEEKLGIKGSSTRQVFFENVKIPKENLLGEIGKGHLIAFNVLNAGRYKLGVLSLGGAKQVVNEGVQYANDRVQFGKSIANFGAIKYKIAEATIQTFAGMSTTYRVSNLMQQKVQMLKAEGKSFAEAKLLAAEEYAIESSILKVAGSEITTYVIDEMLQVHGGMGFSEETNIARAYRDIRIGRIYEGTNEINRLLIVDMLLKRAMKGVFDLAGPAWAVQKELTSMPTMEAMDTPYAYEKKAIKDFKKAILMVSGAAVKMQMDGKLNLKEEQEVLMNISDMMIDTFNAESMLLRIEKLSSYENKNCEQEIYDAMLKVFINDANDRLRKNASDAIASFAEEDLIKTFILGLKRFTNYPPVNVKELRRKVADKVIATNAYPFS
jgi:alkylation response protein AidB-like acyl-CoA dehydrogenase